MQPLFSTYNKYVGEAIIDAKGKSCAEPLACN